MSQTQLPHDQPFARGRQFIYRLRQFFQGLHARITPAEQQMIVHVLPERAATLFFRLPLDAQRHSLNVLHTLQAAGYQQADLAVAALLHDVGKLAADEAGLRLNLWLRGPLVLLEAIAPQYLEQLATDDVKQGWRYALYVHRQHPQIGAAWARSAGCTTLACWLIESHQCYQLDDQLEHGMTNSASGKLDKATLLLALQWADARN